MTDSSHYSRGAILYEQGNFEQALKVFMLAYTDDPDCGATACMIACCFERLDQIDDALHWSRQAVSLDPESSLAYHILGRSLYCKQGHVSKEVLQVFQNSIKYNPHDTQNFSYLSSAYSTTRDWKKSLHWAEQGVRLDPLSARCLALEGWSLFHLGELSKAETKLKESLQLEPNSAATHRYLAHLEIIKGDMAQAREHITEAHRINPDPVIDINQNQAGYAYTSHDLMCDIVKADGTLYGKVLSIGARFNHGFLVQEAKLGNAYPILVIVVLAGASMLCLTAGVLFKGVVPYAVSNTIMGIVLCALFLVIGVIPGLLWYVSTGRMLLKQSSRRYVTERQKNTLIALPLLILFIGGVTAIGVTYSDHEEKSFKTSLTNARKLEDAGDFRGASAAFKRAIKEVRTSGLSAYRLQRAAHQAGLAIESPEKEEPYEGSKAGVTTTVAEAAYKELKERAAAAMEKDATLKDAIAKDFEDLARR